MYAVLNTEGVVRAQGAGRALNLSPGGMMIETGEPLSEKNIKIRASKADGRSIAIEGTIRYSMPHAPRTYRSGIKLTGTTAQVAEFVAELGRNTAQVGR